ncbi:MAG: serine protease [Desulfobulbales bacterium]|nr:serine protease [Desulfobulbales bacterium]
MAGVVFRFVGLAIFSGFMVFLNGLTVHAEVGDIRDSVVKIFVVRNRPDYTNPWNMFGSTSVSGSGCVLEGNRILTNAHVVSDQTFIQVRSFGKSKKYVARVEAIAHEADLALLRVDDPDFFRGIVPLTIGDLPRVQQDVTVYGFPYGGDALSTTKGVVSRIEHQVYAHSLLEFLAVQIDAAINMGSSGGPVLMGNKVVGVAMQYMGSAENIGYMVPAPLIKHFLDDLKDGRYDGFPDDGVICQTMENEGLRRMYGLPPDRTGCLVYLVQPGSPGEGAILIGDVIMEIDGHGVAEDGTIEFRPKERTSMNYFTQSHQIGEELALTIWRAGKELREKIVLNVRAGENRLVPIERHDIRPTYYIFGGLIFSPLTVNYLKSWGATWYNDAPKNLLARYYFDHLTQAGEEIVNLVRVLPAEVNKGYHYSGDYRIEKVNGQPIKNLRHLIDLVENSRGEFVVFSDRWGATIVLDRRAAEKDNAGILETYRIPADRSADLK